MELKVVHLQHLDGGLSVKLMPLPAEVPTQLVQNVGEPHEATFHFVEKSGPVHVYQEVEADDGAEDDGGAAERAAAFAREA